MASRLQRVSRAPLPLPPPPSREHCLERGRPSEEKELIVYLDSACYAALTRVAEESGNQQREVGGFLFGVDVDPLDCARRAIWIREFKAGPGLGGPGHYEFGTEVMHAILDARAADPKTSDMAILGWYHTHPHMSPFLSEPDLAFFRSFNRPSQVALVIAPNCTLPWALDLTTGGFFIRTEESYRAVTGFYEVTEGGKGTLHRWLDLGEESQHPQDQVATSEPPAALPVAPTPPTTTAAPVDVPAVTTARLDEPILSSLPTRVAAETPELERLRKEQRRLKRWLWRLGAALLFVVSSVAAWLIVGYWQRVPELQPDLRSAQRGEAVTFEVHKDISIVRGPRGAGSQATLIGVLKGLKDSKGVVVELTDSQTTRVLRPDVGPCDQNGCVVKLSLKDEVMQVWLGKDKTTIRTLDAAIGIGQQPGPHAKTTSVVIKVNDAPAGPPAPPPSPKIDLPGYNGSSDAELWVKYKGKHYLCYGTLHTEAKEIFADEGGRLELIWRYSKRQRPKILDFTAVYHVDFGLIAGPKSLPEAWAPPPGSPSTSQRDLQDEWRESGIVDLSLGFAKFLRMSGCVDECPVLFFSKHRKTGRDTDGLPHCFVNFKLRPLFEPPPGSPGSQLKSGRKGAALDRKEGKHKQALKKGKAKHG